MTPWLAAIFVSLLCGSVVGSPAGGTEPTAPVVLVARTESIVPSGRTARVVVLVTVESRRDLPTTRLRGWLPGRGGFERAFGIPERIVPIRRGVGRTERYTLELESGRLHHLFFGLRPDEALVGDPAGADLATTYLRVNLDPRLEPEPVGDLLQFSATMSGSSAP